MVAWLAKAAQDAGRLAHARHTVGKDGAGVLNDRKHRLHLVQPARAGGRVVQRKPTLRSDEHDAIKIRVTRPTLAGEVRRENPVTDNPRTSSREEMAARRFLVEALS